MNTSPTTPFRFLSDPSKSRFLSTSVTPYPFQYEMIVSRPANTPLPPSPRRNRPPPKSKPEPSEMGFDEWVDKKLSTKNTQDNNDGNREPVMMDKAKRKYYNKRRKRMYGESDSDDEYSYSRRGNDSDFIELKQEVVEFRTLHHREEELYFYDAFSYPWEKNKHYKMVYQMEKKYFPDQCFDKAFLDPGKPNVKKSEEGVEDRGLVFFEEKKNEVKDVGVGDVTEKKVEDFFKCLKKFPNEEGDGVAVQEPLLSTRSVGLPPSWDGPTGTVVLVNKPKGGVFFSLMIISSVEVY